MSFLSTDQQQTLIKKNWNNIIPDGAYLDLYPEDFEPMVWEQVCDQLNISVNSSKATILYVAITDKN